MSRAAQVRRTATLSTLPLASLGYAAAGGVRRLLGEDPDEVTADLRRRSAERTRRILGEAKGGALKAGQLLSTVAALFPTDPEDTWHRALSQLPANNPALPFAEVEPVLIADLGPRWRSTFAAFDDHAVAAASIGQVHRATLADGTEVAVKVQYPGVDDSLRSDLRIVSAMTRLGALVAPGMALPPLVVQMRDRLAEELDYRREGRVQQAFVEGFTGEGAPSAIPGADTPGADIPRADIPRAAIPGADTPRADTPRAAIPGVQRATGRVLVTDWQDGTPFTALADADQATRNAAASAYMAFLLAGPATVGWLHTDPHPGNFRWIGEGPDGHLGVLDFGSALPMPAGMPRTFGRLITLLRAEDASQTLAGLVEEGFVSERAAREGKVDAVKLRDYLAPFSEPSRHEVFAFSPEWLRSQFGRLGDPRNPDFAVALQLTMPPEHLFTHRVWLGIVGVLCQLRATIPVRDVVRRWLPGLE